jgi:hypothetical protein
MANADRSVDVDEPKDSAPPADSGPPVLAAAASRLSPVQEAYGAYARHHLHCRTCRDIDGGPCAVAADLHAAWERLSADAFGRLAGETA